MTVTHIQYGRGWSATRKTHNQAWVLEESIKEAGYIHKDELLSHVEHIRMVVKYVKHDGELVSHCNKEGLFVRWAALKELIERL